MSRHVPSDEAQRAAEYCDTRADAILASRAADRIQPGTRKLPTEAEMAEARFAAQQVRLLGEELRNGFHLDDGETGDG